MNSTKEAFKMKVCGHNFGRRPCFRVGLPR